MKLRNTHRIVSMLLAISLTLSMTGRFAFAADDGAVGEPIVTAAETVTITQETPSADETTPPAEDAATGNEQQDTSSDPSGSESVLPGEDANEPDCACPPVDSGEVVHGEDCPLYTAPEQPEQTECTCPPVDSGEIVHIEGCPLYEAEKPALPEQSDAAKAALALIAALPTVDELAMVDTEGDGFAEYLAQLRLDTAAARAAFDALTAEEKAAFDAAALEKLTALEAVLAAMPVPMAGRATPVTTWAELQTAINAALTDGTETAITISGTIDSATISSKISIGDSQNITIDGGKIEGAGESLFTIKTGAVLTLKNFQVDGKNQTVNSAAIIDNSGTLNIGEGCVFENLNFPSSSTHGGIINSRMDCNVTGGIFRNNTSTGSERFNSVGLYNIGSLKITGGTFSNNRHTGTGLGAAVYNTSTAKCYISGGTFDSGNVAVANKAGIFHSSQQGSSGEMHLSSNPTINCPLFLDAGEAKNFIYLDGALTGNVTLKPAKYEEDYVLVKAADTYTLTNDDYLNIKLLQPASGTWYTKLSADGKSIVATAAAGERLATVYVAPVNGDDANDGKAAATAIKTFDKAKQLLANGGTIILVPPVTISGNELWELPGSVFGDGTLVTDDGTTTITVGNGGNLTLGDVTIDGIDRIEVESGGSVTIGNATVIKPETGGTTDIVVGSGGTLEIGSGTNLDGIDSIYTTGGGTVIDNGNTGAGSKIDSTTTPPTVTDPVPVPAAITIEVNDGTAVGGASLEAAVTASSKNANAITKLKITAGEVTAADWKYFAGGTPGSTTSPFTALTTFEVAGTTAVTAVADIPGGENKNPIFPTTIERVTIPKATSIGFSAFFGCTSLTTVSLPAAITIHASTFSGCTSLTTVSLPAAITIHASTFSGCTALATVSLSAATSIGNVTFKDCKVLANVSLPGVKTIGNTAFQDCTALTSVSLPVVESIDRAAFWGCTQLATLKLGAAPPTVTNANAFTNCPATRNITIVGADGTTELTDTALTTAQAAYDAVADGISDSTATDGKWYGWKVRDAAAADKITIKVNNGNTEYGGENLQAAVTAAGGASDITTLTVTKGGLTASDWSTIKSLSALAVLDIKAGVAGSDIPDGLSNYGQCITNLTTIKAADAKSIGTEAFYALSKLTTIDFPNVETIGAYAFFYSGITDAVFPKVKSIGVKGQDPSSPSSVFTSCPELKNAEFATAEFIEANSFENCVKLKTVSFPKVKEIGRSAFQNTADAGMILSSADFRAVEKIGANAFEGCKEFKTLTLGAVPPTVEDKTAFEKCPPIRSLALVNADGTPLTDATVLAKYDAVVDGISGSTATDDLWYGWKIGSSAATVPVTGVTVNKTTLSLEAGKTETLTATVAPANATNKAVTWKSSNAAVATVTDGVVSALTAGTATITVTTTDGGKTATCAVTVTAKVIKPAPGGELTAPLDQTQVDDVFGEGNATLDSDGETIHINNDITVDNSIIITATPVTIDLGGNTVTGDSDANPVIKIDNGGTGTINGGGSISGGSGNTAVGVGDNTTVTIDGETNISGGDSTTGNGGNGITGGTGSDITIGGGVTVEGGDGGAGGDGIQSGGNVTVDGSVTGGNGSSGNGGDGVDTSGGSGNITIKPDGSATGGSGGTGSGGAGGNGGNGTETGSGGSTTIDSGGTTTGGTGGAGSGSGDGGNGGTGTEIGGGTAGGNGSATGGDGGNISEGGTGNPGSGGAGVSGGDPGSITTTPGKPGCKVTTSVDDSKAGTTVTVPEADLAGAVEIKPDDIANGSTVKVELKVEKKNDQPDKSLIEAALGALSADTIGSYFDITLFKTITDSSGATGTPEQITDANKEIEITMEIPPAMRGGSDYTIIRVHGTPASTTVITPTKNGNNLIFKTNQFSTYAIAYTKGGGTPTPPPSGGSSGGSSSGNAQHDFWMDVKYEIEHAASGDVVEVNAHAYDQLPWNVVQALHENPGVTLTITRPDGSTITIPAGKAPKDEAGRINWSLAELDKLYAGTITPGSSSDYNPETGGALDNLHLSSSLDRSLNQPAQMGVPLSGALAAGTIASSAALFLIALAAIAVFLGLRWCWKNRRPLRIFAHNIWGILSKPR